MVTTVDGMCKKMNTPLWLASITPLLH